MTTTATTTMGGSNAVNVAHLFSFWGLIDPKPKHKHLLLLYPIPSCCPTASPLFLRAVTKHQQIYTHAALFTQNNLQDLLPPFES